MTDPATATDRLAVALVLPAALVAATRKGDAADWAPSHDADRLLDADRTGGR